MVGSIGLKIYGEGESNVSIRKTGFVSLRVAEAVSRCQCDTHEIVAVELTPDDLGDICEMLDLFDQIDADFSSMMADGAYDGEAVYMPLPSVTGRQRSSFHHGYRPSQVK